jgi:hypothetical protein
MGIALHVAVEPNLVVHVRAGQLPWVGVYEPWVRRLELGPVGSDELLEDTVLVPETVTPYGELLRSAAVKVACGEPAQTAVAEPSISLLGDDVLEVETERLQAVIEFGLETEVEEGVVECTAHEELEREVVGTLRLLLVVVKLGLVPVDLVDGFSISR